MTSRDVQPVRIRATRGFTLVELLVVIGIIGVLIAILIPVIGKVRQQAKTTQCLSNLRQIGHAITAYATENRGKVVPADLMPPDPYKPVLRLGNWATILVAAGFLHAPDAGDPLADPAQSVFHCPEGHDADGFQTDAYTAQRTDDAQGGYWKRQELSLLPDGSTRAGVTVLLWYGINADLAGDDFPSFRCPSDTGRSVPRNFTDIRNSSEVALVYDGFFHHDTLANLMGHARHNNRTITNYLLADGHAESVRTESLPRSFDPSDLRGSFPKFRLSQ